MTTQEQIADPFAAGAAVEDEDFAKPARDYLEIADLDGRLLIVFPETIGELVSEKNGKPYDRIIGDVVIVDGPLTDKIPALPHLAPAMHLSASGVVAVLRAHVGKGKPVLGRVDSRPSKFNKLIPAYGLADPEDKDKTAATPALRKYRAGGFE